MAYQWLAPIQFVTNGDLSGNFTSGVIDISQQDNIGIQLGWDGDPVGEFFVEISMTYEQDNLGNVLNTGNWIPITLDPTITAAGAADTAYIDLNQLSAPYMRITYASDSGDGDLQAYATAKAV